MMISSAIAVHSAMHSSPSTATRNSPPAAVEATIPTPSMSAASATAGQQEKPPADESTPAGVVQLFATRYYGTFVKNIHKLWQFYAECSQVTVGNEGCDTVSVCGVKEIKALIQEVHMKHANAIPPTVNVVNIDFQPLPAIGSILVFITGVYVSHEPHAHASKFTQTFILAPQPNGYFVANDILRFHVLPPPDLLTVETSTLHATADSYVPKHADSGVFSSMEEIVVVDVSQAGTTDLSEVSQGGADSSKPKTWASLAETGRERWTSSAIAPSITGASIPASSAPRYSEESVANSIFISGYGSLNTSDEMIQFLKSHGLEEVATIKIIPNKRCAFVSFESKEAYKKALSAEIIVDGIKVNIVERRPNKGFVKHGSYESSSNSEGYAGERRLSNALPPHQQAGGSSYKKKGAVPDRRKTVLGDFARAASAKK